VVHAVSTTYLRFEHMSPPAAGMALLLHAAVALALYLVSPLRLSEGEPMPPIEVTIESPNQQTATPPTPPAIPEPQKPAEAAAAQPLPPAPSSPPPSAPRAQPQASGSNVPLGMPPPESKTAEKPSEATTKPPEPQEAASPPRPQLESVEKELPQVAPPPAPLSMQDFVRIAPPPPPQEIARPAPRPTPAPAPQRQQLQPSPLSSHSHPDAPQAAHNPSNTMVNPAEANARNRALDEYAWAVIRKFSQYLPNLRDKNEGGTVVLKFTIARDGRLLDVVVTQSSGVIALDRGMLEAIKTAAPYPPLPAEFPGDRATFTQPITAKR
jgi:protein TonB